MKTSPMLTYFVFSFFPSLVFVKDGFYSSSLAQTGGQTVGPETIPDREALMATLSCAMVGPMDGINLLNKTRIMQTCRSDGVVLKPDRPVVMSDACFGSKRPYDDPVDCYIYHTVSKISGMPSDVHYFFNADPERAQLERDMLTGIDADTEYVVTNWYDGSVATLHDSNNTLAMGYEGHAYAVVTPVLPRTSWVLLGEKGKFVSLSSKRYTSVRANETDGSLRVELEGAAGETVTTCAAKKTKASYTVSCVDATFEKDGARTSIQFGASEAVGATAVVA